MTLPPRHRILNSNPGNLRPSTLPFGHGGSEQLDVIFIVAQLPIVGDIYLDLISESFIQNIFVTSIICALICVASRKVSEGLSQPGITADPGACQVSVLKLRSQWSVTALKTPDAQPVLF